MRTHQNIYLAIFDICIGDSSIIQPTTQYLVDLDLHYQLSNLN